MSGKKSTRTSGNVFRALGFDAVEAEDLRLRSDLMIALKDQILARGESQTTVAKALGVAQPRVSNLLKGHIHLFSLDSLVEMLGRLGNTVELNVRSAHAEHQAIATTTDQHVVAAGWAAATERLYAEGTNASVYFGTMTRNGGGQTMLAEAA